MRLLASKGVVWTAWGFVGAAALPVGTLDLGPNVRIESPTVARLDGLRQETPRLQHPTVPWPEYFSALPAQVIVRSTRIIWFRTQAATMEEAWDHIERNEVPAVIVALAGTGERPRIELVRIGATDLTGLIDRPTSRWIGGTFGGFATRPLTGSEARTLARRHVAGRKYAADLCRLYYQASQQYDQSDQTPRSLGNVVSNYFLLLEAIARREAGQETLTEGARQEAADHIARLQKALSTTNTVEGHANKIRSTLQHVERLEQRYLNQKIQATATRLKLDAATLANALEIARLRNTTLSHPGRETPQSMNAIAAKAEQTARAFLSAFIADRTR